jgi:tetratricopeptide (TPR) repeat protein
MSSSSLPVTSALCLLLAIGCTDKAKPEFERCEQLEAGKKYDEAREACQRAVAADPESKCGKLAAARLPVIANEASKAAQAQRADDAAFEEHEAKLAALKGRFDAALARIGELQAALSQATDPGEKSRIESNLAQTMTEKNAIATEMRGGKPSSGKPCSCPPGDPLCACP